MKITRRLLWLTAVAAFAVSCESEVEVPVNPNPKPGPPADGYVWREIPEARNDLPNTQSVAHYIYVNNKKVRNFSLLYDTKEKVSYWVAYPMHRMYKGSFGRLENYAYDPYFPSSDQMPVTAAQGGYGGGYQRGHQIASHDRTISRLANDQTFYITNMTPQNGTLNGGEWAALEGWIRGIATSSNRSDTLYVVTGCAIRTPQNQTVNYITTRGVKGAVPKAYYKVLLRTRSGEAKWPTNDDAMCIGVWMENKAPTGKYTEHMMSVSDIEALTGHTFFPAISSAVKDIYSPSDWGIY